MIEQSKKMLFDLKIMEDHREEQVSNLVKLAGPTDKIEPKNDIEEEPVLEEFMDTKSWKKEDFVVHSVDKTDPDAEDDGIEIINFEEEAIHPDVLLATDNRLSDPSP